MTITDQLPAELQRIRSIQLHLVFDVPDVSEVLAASRQNDPVTITVAGGLQMKSAQPDGFAHGFRVTDAVVSVEVVELRRIRDVLFKQDKSWSFTGTTGVTHYWEANYNAPGRETIITDYMVTVTREGVASYTTARRHDWPNEWYPYQGH